MYEIRRAGLKGLGVFALTPIPRGTRIFSEKPLLSISQAQDAQHIFPSSRLLSLADRSTLLSLSSHATTELKFLRWSQALWFTLKSFSWQRLRGIGEHVTILSIFRSNSFAFGPQASLQQALFGEISRINHSCIPNAQGNFHEELGRFNVHATRNVEQGEELTLNYLPEEGAVTEARKGRLLSGYGFECQCPACNADTGKLGEEGRVEMSRALKAFAEGEQVDGDGSEEEELKVVRTFLETLEGQGVAGREVSVLYFEAAKLNGRLGRWDEALELAERGLEIDRDCLGEDHDLYKDSARVVLMLKERC